MVNKSRMMPAVLAVAVVVAFLTTGCIRWSTQSRPVVNGPAAAEFAVALRNRVSTDAMMAHLSKLQDIANANDGTRAVGTPGYQASVDYVVNTLRNSGFDVQTPEFSARVFKAEKGVVTLGGNTVEARALEYSLGTPPDGVTGPLVAAPADDSPLQSVGLRQAAGVRCGGAGRSRRLSFCPEGRRSRAARCGGADHC